MPPQRQALARRFATFSGSFYDKSGSIGDGLPSPTVASSSSRNPDRDFDMYSGYYGEDIRESEDAAGGNASDDEYTLTGYGEMSTDKQFMLPPSPTQTIKYRYRAYRPKHGRNGKKVKSSASSRAPLKIRGSASDLSSILAPYLSGRTPKRDFQALMQRYRESAEGWRDSETSVVTPRKTYADLNRSGAAPLRRTGSGVIRAAP